MSGREHQALADLLDAMQRAMRYGVEVEHAQVVVGSLHLRVGLEFVDGRREYATTVTCANHKFDLIPRSGAEPLMACVKCGTEEGST